ncbi:MAG: SpoIIE family protein phosphatase [Candidatus Xenobia bacterium]
MAVRGTSQGVDSDAHPVLDALSAAGQVLLRAYDGEGNPLTPPLRDGDPDEAWYSGLVVEALSSRHTVQSASSRGVPCAALPLACGAILVVAEDGPLEAACAMLVRAQTVLSRLLEDLQQRGWSRWGQTFGEVLQARARRRIPRAALLAFVADEVRAASAGAACGIALWDSRSRKLLDWACSEDGGHSWLALRALLEEFSLSLDGPPAGDAVLHFSWPLVYELEIDEEHHGLLALRLSDETSDPPPDLREIVCRALRPVLAGWNHRPAEDIGAFFSQLSLAFAAAPDLKSLLKIVVEQAILLLNVEAGSVCLVGDRKVLAQVAVGLEEAEIHRPVGASWLEPATENAGLELDMGAWGRGSPGLCYVGVPLMFKDDVVGLLNLYGREVRQFFREEVRLLNVFASHAALAIENARAFELEQRRAQEVTLLFLAARAVGQCQRLSEVLQVGADQMTRVAEVDRCLVMLLDDGPQEFFTAACLGLSEDQQEFFGYYRMGMLELDLRFLESLQKGRLYVLSSAPADCPPLQKLFNLLPSSSALMVPLVVHETLVGLVWLDDSRIAHHFTTAQTRLVQALAIHLGTAIHRARLLDQMEDNLRQTRTLYEISTALSGTLSPARVHEMVIDKAFSLMGRVPCALLTQSENGGALQLNAQLELPEELASEPLLMLVAAAGLRSRKPSGGGLDDERRELEPVLEAMRVHLLESWLVVPLLTKRKVMGALVFFGPAGVPLVADALMESFANQVAIAMDSSRLHNVVRNKVRELATLFEVGKAITSTLHLSQVLEAIAINVRKVTVCDAISIMLMDPVQNELAMTTIIGLGRHHQGVRIKSGHGVAGLAVKTGRPMICQDVPGDASSPLKFPASVRQDGMKTILSVPMRARGRVVGLLNIYLSTLYCHSQSEINLLTTLANQAAIAIDNARLYEEKNQVSTLMRAILIPQREFQHPSLEVGHKYLSSMELSGDYYDMVSLKDGKVAFTVADVSGKGPKAATFAVRTKYIVRSYALAGYPPREILTRTNAIMEPETGTDMFISLFHCQVDPVRRILTYSSGGHEPPLFWIHQSRTAAVLDGGGLLLGVEAGWEYGEHEMQVDPGDLLILYTDGVTETRNDAGEQFGIGRIQEIIERFPSISCQTLANKIFSSVLKFSGKKLLDDFSLLVLRF